MQQQCLDAILAQSLDDGVDLLVSHCEIPVNSRFAATRRLGHEQGAPFHLCRQRRIGRGIRNRLGARNVELVRTALSLALLNYDLVELIGGEI